MPRPDESKAAAKTDGAAAPDEAAVANWTFLPIGLAGAAIVLAADQISKWVIVDLVMDPPRIISVLPVFNLVLVYNRGVSFGLCDSCGAYVLSALAVAVSGGLVWWLRKAETRLLALALGVIIGGAIGNVVDRLRFEAVVDFLDFFIPGYAHGPAFNVADSAIFAGVAIILLDAFIAGRVKNE